MDRFAPNEVLEIYEYSVIFKHEVSYDKYELSAGLSSSQLLHMCEEKVSDKEAVFSA